VDDLLVVARQDCIGHIEQSKTALDNKYGVKDLGEAMSFLNIRILRDLKAKKLWVYQDGYIDKLCSRFGIDVSLRSVATPLVPSYLSNDRLLGSGSQRCKKKFLDKVMTY
jgi:hypothetical protein